MSSMGTQLPEIQNRQNAAIFEIKEPTEEDLASERFEVLHVAFGPFPRGFVFTREQFDIAHPLPPNADRKKWTVKKYTDNLLARGLRGLGGVQGPAIRPTKLPAGGKVSEFIAGANDIFAGKADMTQAQLKEAIKTDAPKQAVAAVGV